jgi:5-formyltetrahydrofolate cyclo-ligase
VFTEARTILAFFSFKQEPDLSPLFSLDKNWGFSRCVGNDLIWHSWSTVTELPLQKNGFGILEPHPDTQRLDPETVDLVLVPAVACDRQGHRLGYGGGFYDRMLSSQVWANKPTLGVVFEFSWLDSLPSDPWDMPLRGVCTEAGTFLI